ncbi:MAG TPA: hypothetical protein VK760_16040 [Candidatus Acidoferrales bacterium]|jgi:hypothetical protein|nr:hypothetical protein [Candidatus Acidoferrales bacterium]
MKRPFYLAVALAAAAVVSSAAPVLATSSNPINVTQCFISQPKLLSKTAGGTQIDYVNTSKKTATMVTFAVGYRNAQSNFLRKVTDSGTFTPGTPVNHHFDLYNDVTYAGKQVHGCSAVAVKFADGSKWSI